MEETTNTKNNDKMYKPDTFHKICNTCFNHVASAGHPVAAGDCLLHYLCSEKKKLINISPKTFYTQFQKVIHAVQRLDCCYEKELNNT